MDDIFDTLNPSAAANTFAMRYLLIAFEKLTGIEGVGKVNSYKEFRMLTKEMSRSSKEDAILAINSEELKENVMESIYKLYNSDDISYRDICDIVIDVIHEFYHAVHNNDVKDIILAKLANRV